MKGWSRPLGNRNFDDRRLRIMVGRGKDPVIRPNEPVSSTFHRNRRPIPSDPRINHHQVHGSRRESMPGAPQNVRRRANVPRRNLVGDVYHGYARGKGGDDPFYFTDVGVGGAEIREESDERHV